MPSHLGFLLNELADKAAETAPIGPPAFPHHTLASRLWFNRSLVVTEWRTMWAAFAASKALKLKIIKPNAWDGKGKQLQQHLY